ncbi:colanic acid/amylovoran biosynthesis glycosyltransferase [Bradyrhizobium sp. AZCC 1693]
MRLMVTQQSKLSLDPASVQSNRPAIIYLVNQYPAVTHTFIKREVLALERLGVEVIRLAFRAGKALVDPGDVDEEKRTNYLLRRPLSLLLNTISLLLLRPRPFVKALATTLRMMRRSDRSPLKHIAYLIEACGVAAVVCRTGAGHIHAHFGTNPAEVALLASQLSGASYSFTVHGCEEFDKPEFIGLRTKIHGAAFVVAVSYYGRAQLYRWCDTGDQGKIKLVRCGLEQHFHEAADDAPCEAARFLCVGQLYRLKGQDVLVKAAAVMAAAGHKFEVILVGDGESRAELELLISSLNLSKTVRLVGWLSSADVRRQMIGARALVVPSFAENSACRYYGSDGAAAPGRGDPNCRNSGTGGPTGERLAPACKLGRVARGCYDGVPCGVARGTLGDGSSGAGTCACPA